MASNIDVVRAFIAAFGDNDLERIMAFFTPDAVYHNMPLAPVTGTRAIRGVLQGFMGMAKEVEWVLHRIAEAADGAVLTERTDRFLIGDRWVELPVMGSFVLRDGKVAEWRDYFDLQQFQRQLPGEAAQG